MENRTFRNRLEMDKYNNWVMKTQENFYLLAVETVFNALVSITSFTAARKIQPRSTSSNSRESNFARGKNVAR